MCRSETKRSSSTLGKLVDQMRNSLAVGEPGGPFEGCVNVIHVSDGEVDKNHCATYEWCYHCNRAVSHVLTFNCTVCERRACDACDGWPWCEPLP